jgi:hypothetical protein
MGWLSVPEYVVSPAVVESAESSSQLKSWLESVKSLE